MLSEEIYSINRVLGSLLPRVDTDSAEMLRLVRRNLEATAEQVESIERNLIMPSRLAHAQEVRHGESS